MKTAAKAAMAVPVVGAALTGSVVGGSIVIACSAAAYFWLRPQKASPADESLAPTRRGICTDRYSASKVPEKVDVIIIGSGMSALSCGAILARSGKRVLVLEQHDRTGGGTHTYDLGPGNYTFDSGLHYAIPECGKLLQLCTGGEKEPVEFDLMGETGGETDGVTYDRIFVGDEQPFDIKLWQKHVPELYRRFPENKTDIDKYIREASEAVDSVPFFVLSKLMPLWLQKLMTPIILKKFRKHAGRTMKEVLTGVTKNPKLAALLGSLWIDTGSPPEKSSFFLGAAVLWGFPQKGGAYPRGGSQRMSAVLVPVIEKFGGRVLVRAEVKEIVIQNGKAVGVRLANGDEHRAPMVISSIGFNNTFQKLLPNAATEAAGIPRELPVKDSNGFVMVNLGLKGSAQELGLTCANAWYIPIDKKTGDMFESLERHWKDPLAHPDEIPMFISFPSMKDREWESKHPGQHTCQVLIMAETRWFAEWAAKQSSKRGEAYEALKTQWCEAAVQKLLQLYPKIEGHIDFRDVSTPLTIEYYIRSSGGGAVGLDHTPERFVSWEVQEFLDSSTRIPGLWMTGQDTVLCGQPLVQLAGVITAFRILGPLASARIILQSIFF